MVFMDTIQQDRRVVVHMDLDTFFVSVERLRDSRLKGRPLIIGGIGGRGVVSSCSYEARKFGVRSGMPMKLARRLCPEATVISGDHEAYGRFSDMVTDVLRESAPVFEKASVDEFYVDMTGMERFHGTFSWAQAVRDRVGRETGLPMSFGLSVNKMMAKVATNEVKPGALEVPQDLIQPFLDPLGVQKIPMVGEKTAQTLVNMGVKQVKVLREIPRPFLQRIFGKPGDLLWQRARGLDNSPVEPYCERKSISAERTFPEDSIHLDGMRATLTRLAEQLGFGLRNTGKLCACITVKLRYADFNTVTRQERIPYTASDHVLIQKALTLFEQLYDRRQRVRLLGIRLSHLVHGGQPISLFENTERQVDLYMAVDKIKRRFGSDMLMRANALGGVDRQHVHTETDQFNHAGRPQTSVPRATSREIPLWLPDGTQWTPTPNGA